MNDSSDVSTLIAGLASESESSRKYSVFKLQSLLGDPSFADAFMRDNGLAALRPVVIDTTGNTQAYALGSLTKLLELDMGWDAVDLWVVEKVSLAAVPDGDAQGHPLTPCQCVTLAVSHPLVNIVRNALTLLVYVVSHPAADDDEGETARFGFRAIKPVLEHHPPFLESLVSRLSASDHLLVANALRLINALMRDAVLNGGDLEWPKFIKRLQDLGVIGGVGMLMRGDAATDAGSPLAVAILEFQGLTKMLLRKWKEVRVNVDIYEHKKALKTMHLLSKPEPYHPPPAPETNGEHVGASRSRRHHPEKWRRLGFETESPASEFDETGYLGMMDLVDFARRNEDTYQKTLMEQAVHPWRQRCPLARASLSVTLILYEHFEIDESTADFERGALRASLHARVREAHATGALDRLYSPLLLQWGRLHTAALNAFLRLWKAAGAEAEDLFKIEEAVRIVVERVVGAANRKTEVARVEDELRAVRLDTARAWQMLGLDDVYEDAWGPHLAPVRDQLYRESLLFLKEQRIRCLLAGAWFPAASTPAADAADASPPPTAATTSWRFVRLGPERRWLHLREYPAPTPVDPPLADLAPAIDLLVVTSVDSNVTTGAPPPPSPPPPPGSTDTLTDAGASGTLTTTTITLYGMVAAATAPAAASDAGSAPEPPPPPPPDDEQVLLELRLPTSPLASEWLDGLLMLLRQEPITKDTARLVDMAVDWGVRLRLLNLRWEDVDWEGVEGTAAATREVPSREGLDADYWYAMPG